MPGSVVSRGRWISGWDAEVEDFWARTGRRVARDQVDLAIYDDPSHKVRYKWKEGRDMQERVLTAKEVRESFEK
jgi:uridine kinase